MATKLYVIDNGYWYFSVDKDNFLRKIQQTLATSRVLVNTQRM